LQLRSLAEKVKEVKLRFPEGDWLLGILMRTEKWQSEAREALSCAPDLKKLTALLEDAATIPVDLRATCEQLNEKVDQAHKWVEKVRAVLGRLACSTCCRCCP
jgi:hypothetical protein